MENNPREKLSDLPVSDLLARIKKGVISPHALDKSTRQLCVDILMMEGYSHVSIASLFKISDRTVRRDVVEIRRRNAVSASPELTKQLVGELIAAARNHYASQKQIARTKDAFDDEKYRSGGIRLHYPSTGGAIEGLKPGILLEVGFDQVTPNKPLQISSWALAFAQEKKMAVEDNAAMDIHCYDPRYTFVEKLQTIAKKYNQHQSTKALPSNFIRHYYDVMCLLEVKEVRDFIGTEAYQKHKEERFRGNLRGLDLSRCEAFLLSDKATRALFLSEYEKTKSLYYSKRPSFDDIVASINKYLPKF